MFKKATVVVEVEIVPPGEVSTVIVKETLGHREWEKSVIDALEKVTCSFGAPVTKKIVARQTLAAHDRPMSASKTPVTLRLMTEQDLPMLHDWLNRPHIVEWWGGEEERPTLDDVLEHYLPRVLAEESVTPYIAMLGGEPIGYAQSYVALGSGDGWWEDETDPGVRGIDQSLANPTQLNIGLGTKLVQALVELLFSDPNVTKIQTDPAQNNLRAIRCYEKAGFVQHKVITTPDGPAVYMAQTRQAFESARSAA